MDDASRWDAVEEAVELLREGELESAQQALDGVLKEDPQNQYAWYYTGTVQFERGQFIDASVSYREALRFAPKYLAAAVGLGHALRLAGRAEEAVTAGMIALDIARTREVDATTTDSDAHWLLALAYAQLNKPDLAIRHAEAFLLGNPELEAQAEAKALLDSLRGQARPLKSVN